MSDEPDLTFPDLPRTQLEELLGQLTDRAKDVLTSQGRLRALIRANATVTSELSLRPMLRHIVSAARQLVGARYAALGVIGHDGSLDDFIHVGMDETTARRIGDLPTGMGLLGLPTPVRVADLASHPEAVGFPQGHPPMGSFLGVPIRVRRQVFGNLYLTDSVNGEFSREDEQLVAALAGNAGVAIENARLYQELQNRQQWLAASNEIMQQLLGQHDELPLDLVLRYAMRGAEADAASIVLSDVLPDPAEPLAQRAIDSGQPVMAEDRYAVSAPLLAGGDRVLGAVTVTRRPGRTPFGDADRDQLAGFTNHVGIALELIRARADRDLLRMVEDHDRIAADLHDHVIQELFATGMGLQRVIPHLRDADQRTRVLGYVEALDATIRRIRTTIFQLHTGMVGAESLRQRLGHVIREETAALGFPPATDFAGLTGDVASGLADDVVAVVREALSNVARHSGADQASLRFVSDGDVLCAEVIDNGRGLGAPARLSGLGNLRRRAESRGGSLDIDMPPGGGTRLRWTARR